MNLERVTAESFLAELQKIASESSDEGAKTAAAGLFDAMTVEDVESFLKEAGFGAMLGGIGRGVAGLAGGAAKGLGSLAAGAGRGVVGAAGNAASAVGQGVSNAAGAVKGVVQRAGSAAASAPGALGAKMTAFGQGVQNKLQGMGQGLAQAGQAKGQAIQSRLAGPAKPVPAAKALAGDPTSSANALDRLSKVHGPEDAPYKPPMMSAGQVLADSNPFHGMIGSAIDGIKNMVKRPPQPAQVGGGQVMAPAYA